MSSFFNSHRKAAAPGGIRLKSRPRQFADETTAPELGPVGGRTKTGSSGPMRAKLPIALIRKFQLFADSAGGGEH